MSNIVPLSDCSPLSALRSPKEYSRVWDPESSHHLFIACLHFLHFYLVVRTKASISTLYESLWWEALTFDCLEEPVAMEDTLVVWATWSPWILRSITGGFRHDYASRISEALACLSCLGAPMVLLYRHQELTHTRLKPWRDVFPL